VKINRLWSNFSKLCFFIYSEKRKDWALQQRTNPTGALALIAEGSKILTSTVMIDALDTRNLLGIIPAEDEFFYHFCEAK
jgi:hypothetical protein